MIGNKNPQRRSGSWTLGPYEFLDGIDLQGFDLVEIDLRNAELNEAELNGAKLNGAELNGAELNEAELNGAKLNGAELNGAELNEAKLNRAKLNGAKLNWAELNGAELNGAELNEAELNGAKLNWAKLNWAELNGAELNRAELNEANLSGVKGLLNPSEYLTANFKFTTKGMIAYKVFGGYKPPPSTWKLIEGEYITEIVNPNPTNDCACGINVATPQWLKNNLKTQHEVWRVLVEVPDLASVIVPYHTNGKIRCGRVKLLERIRLEEISNDE